MEQNKTKTKSGNGTVLSLISRNSAATCGRGVGGVAGVREFICTAIVLQGTSAWQWESRPRQGLEGLRYSWFSKGWASSILSRKSLAPF